VKTELLVLGCFAPKAAFDSSVLYPVRNLFVVALSVVGFCAVVMSDAPAAP